MDKHEHQYRWPAHILFAVVTAIMVVGLSGWLGRRAQLTPPSGTDLLSGQRLQPATPAAPDATAMPGNTSSGPPPTATTPEFNAANTVQVPQTTAR